VARSGDEHGIAKKYLRFAMIGSSSGETTLVCFSAAANFIGSGALAAIGVVTLTKVKHRRELLFAALPTLFAVHQFIEGFVWLGWTGFSPLRWRTIWGLRSCYTRRDFSLFSCR
jgi:hypothetical protein